MSKSKKAQMPKDGEKFNYKLKDLIWAKMKGFIPWPAMIVEPTIDLLNQQHKVNAKPVFFFGSRNFAWIEETQMKPFEGPWKEKLASAAKPTSFRKAMDDISCYLDDSTAIDKLIYDNCRHNHVTEHDFDKIRDGIVENEENNDSAASNIDEEAEVSPQPASGVDVGYTYAEAINDERQAEFASTTDDGVLTASNARKQKAKRPLKAKSSAAALPKINVAVRQRNKRRRTATSESYPNKRINDNGTVVTNNILEDFSVYDEDDEDLTREVTQGRTKNIEMNAVLAIQSTCARQTPITSVGLLDRPTITRPQPRPEVDLNTLASILKERNITSSPLTFGFLGIGVMGSIIVKDLCFAKHNVIIWNRTAEKCEPFKELGVDVKSTPIDVVEESDIIFCCVSDPKASKELVFGNCGVLHNKDLKNKGYVELSTMDAEVSREIGAGIAENGGRYLEARIIGTRSEAELGKLVILAAGDESVFRECQSCFKTIAKNTYFLGNDAGNASKVHLILQNIAHVSLAGLSESLALADRCSMSLQDILNIFETTSMCSPMLLAKGREMAKTQSERFFQTEQPVSHVQRDLRLVMDLSDQLDQSMPVSSITHEVFKHTKRLGYGEHDSSAVFVRSRF